MHASPPTRRQSLQIWQKSKFRLVGSTKAVKLANMAEE